MEVISEVNLAFSPCPPFPPLFNIGRVLAVHLQVCQLQVQIRINIEEEGDKGRERCHTSKVTMGPPIALLGLWCAEAVLLQKYLPCTVGPEGLTMDQMHCRALGLATLFAMQYILDRWQNKALIVIMFGH